MQLLAIVDRDDEVSVGKDGDVLQEVADRPGRDDRMWNRGELYLTVFSWLRDHQNLSVDVIEGAPAAGEVSFTIRRCKIRLSASQARVLDNGMADESPRLSHGSEWAAVRVFYPANAYQHPPSGLVQLRVVRRGSSYAEIDLGLGAQRVFTRPGDLLLSLPDRPTSFRIEDGRELTLLQVAPALALEIVQQCGGRGLDDLIPLLSRPVRDSLVAEIVRRLEKDDQEAAIAQRWALGLVFANLLRTANKLVARETPGRLSEESLAALLARVEASLDEAWSVERMASEVGLPRRTFAAFFRGAQGMPAHQYLLRLRADNAAELLRSTDLSIADVALKTGFAHQAHMTGVLSRLKGQTPGRIRSQNR
jgi:AraC family transcriptional regulator